MFENKIFIFEWLFCDKKTWTACYIISIRHFEYCNIAFKHNNKFQIKIENKKMNKLIGI